MRFILDETNDLVDFYYFHIIYMFYLLRIEKSQNLRYMLEKLDLLLIFISKKKKKK
jgi:hypothetical protein